jgi:hypothetical protein
MRKMRVFQRYRLVKRVMKSIGSHCHERYEYVSKNFSPFSFLVWRQRHDQGGESSSFKFLWRWWGEF